MSLYSKLPVSVLNLIGEFNAEHRELMLGVCGEIDFVVNECDGCYRRIVEEEDKIICSMNSRIYVFCCVWCIRDQNGRERRKQ
jgi:hypothetical protein